MEFMTTLNDGGCTLYIELSKTPTLDSEVVCAEFGGVAELSINKIGGGISQALLLKVEDIRDKQWDRLNYKVYDAEREAISFCCRTISSKDIQ